ncbi:MAG: Fic family protein [Alphaproteobacteria bacterium]|nr:Fic family protein [Alphaproteobacteria bacterium]
MHYFKYEFEINPEILSMITLLHEYKGRQELLSGANQDELTTLTKIAKIQSIGASNRIEGIFTTDKRLKQLTEEKTEPINRSEQEIAGYREVLNTIHENYQYIDLSPNVILQLHRDLYSYSSGGGSFKNSDNVIAETDSEGNQKARFVPVSAFQTSEFMKNLCKEFSKVFSENKIDKLLLIPMFILDFLCIHPFNDGNGRMSRLLTLLLIYQAGYKVGKYISVEMLIEKTKETYYESLQSSSVGWHDNKNSYEPFLKYFLGVLIKAYKEFENRVIYLKNFKKSDRIRMLFDKNVGSLSKKQIMEIYPDISKVTAERTLINLVKTRYIRKIGSGRATRYVKNNEKNGEE